VRIISGIYRGKHIHPPRGFRARPTTDYAKESLFNILQNRYDLEELDVLDLFAGTGSISYEFLSRGVRSLVCVEKEPLHHRFIRSTLMELDADSHSPVRLIRGDAFRYLKGPSEAFDLIFADPPYDHARLETLPDLVFSTDILNPEGRFILEHPGQSSFTAHPHFEEVRKYGGVHFSFFRPLP
jgi:16S rRNA (guanine(966)-N(2))-methyltransferase RsmD